MMAIPPARCSVLPASADMKRRPDGALRNNRYGDICSRRVWTTRVFPSDGSRALVSSTADDRSLWEWQPVCDLRRLRTAHAYDEACSLYSSA